MTSPSAIPKVDRMLAWPDMAAALAIHPRPVVLTALRAVLDEVRASLLRGEPVSLTEEYLSERFLVTLAAHATPSLRKVVNGTGIVIHTNLGRAPLSRAVAPLIDEVAYGYSTLEYNLATGERGSRLDHVSGLLRELTGAEAALVVNNNAAAVLLALTALCGGREGIVSRGELVEIGGAFRVPDIMRQSGAILREVGTTNRTHLRDYREAIGPETGLLLKVHPSNFAMVGFTAEVVPESLVTLGREHSLPVMLDAGSGCLIDLTRFGIAGEPTVGTYIRAGVDVVTFSGDKLLGGPQAGIIVGREEFLGPLRRHPLLRALRLDKLTLAALEGTLRLYRDERQALARIPVLRMLTVSAAELRKRGARLLRRLRPSLPAGVTLKLVDGVSQPGGGSYPLLSLPTILIAVSCDGMSPHDIEARFRTAPVPVIGRISGGRFLLDLRTLQEEDLPYLADAIRTLPVGVVDAAGD
jgi:L-seryl-tRNA(Ser) seleniumtransferase